jgi:putative transposase
MKRTGHGACSEDEDTPEIRAVHGTVHNHFNQERHLISRDHYRERRSAALAEWREVMG